jgi:uncharacterized protein YggU (UPF0235/DUF167 family)
MKIIETKDGVILEVFVKPKSKKFEVLLEGDELVSGATSRQKRLLLKGIEKSDVERRLHNKKAS